MLRVVFIAIHFVIREEEDYFKLGKYGPRKNKEQFSKRKFFARKSPKRQKGKKA